MQAHRTSLAATSALKPRDTLRSFADHSCSHHILTVGRAHQVVAHETLFAGHRLSMGQWHESVFASTPMSSHTTALAPLSKSVPGIYLQISHASDRSAGKNACRTATEAWHSCRWGGAQQLGNLKWRQHFRDPVGLGSTTGQLSQQLVGRNAH